MSFNKTINNIYKVGNTHYVKERHFNKNYIKLYEEQKTISKDHHVLRHAFNILKYIKDENNEINPKQYLQENKRERYKLNIYNFEKSFKIEKAKKLFTLNDELMEILLQKISKKNNEDQLKKIKEKVNFKILSLKGIRKLNDRTFNTTKSMKVYNNIGEFKSNESINKNYNISNYESSRRTFMKYEPPTNFYFNNLNNRLKDVYRNINSEENKILSKPGFIKTKYDKKLYLKTIDAKKRTRRKFIIKNPEKIKKKKDLENILFKEYDQAFNKAKNKLYTLYKFPKLKKNEI